MHRTFFFFNDTATTEIYTLSLHDALPISADLGGVAEEGVEEEAHQGAALAADGEVGAGEGRVGGADDLLDELDHGASSRSEEHTSELQSQFHIVCRLLLEKKNKKPSSTLV